MRPFEHLPARRSRGRPGHFSLRSLLVQLVTAGLLATTLVAAAPAEGDGCAPGEDGCLPTRAQCATGDYNGYWSGRDAGRFTVCLALDGRIIAYAGGTAVMPCGDVVVADQVVADGGGDPNPCGRPGAEPGDPPMVAAARALGLNWCDPMTFAHGPEAHYTTCVGEIASFDGVEIDARLTFPAKANGSLPVVTLLHGWGGDRRAYQNPEDDPAGWGWARFLSRGYATLAITARGFWASCGTSDQVNDVDEIEIVTGNAYAATGGVVNVVGIASGGTDVRNEDPDQCREGYTHIAERDYEVRDTRHLLGLLVDAGIADPTRLAVTGASYGGGQSWLLATEAPWPTPAGRTIRIAASVPIATWTDLVDALMPNGRTSVAGDGSSEEPVGVLKQSFFDGFFRDARVRIPVVNSFNGSSTYVSPEQGRFNTFKPEELHSFFDGWAAVWHAGEPYGELASDVAVALRGKSAIFADEYLGSVERGDIEPTPVFAIQGWNDAVFPASQALRMFHRLESVDPDYPVTVALARLGHISDPSQPQMSAAFELAGRFLDAHLLAGGEGAPEDEVYSFDVTCGTDADAVVSGRWSKLTKRSVRLAGTGGPSISSIDVDPVAGAGTDPVTVGVQGGSSACLTQDAPTAGAARWSWPVESPMITLGFPALRVDYSLLGEDATLIAKLWDVSPEGRVLVTRGVYRLAAAAGDAPTGTAHFELFGSHWTFGAGHTIELELSQTDAPFLRPDNLPSSIGVGGVTLELPLLGPPPGRVRWDGRSMR